MLAPKETCATSDYFVLVLFGSDRIGTIDRTLNVNVSLAFWQMPDDLTY